jgi:ubiquinone/menaquinone biosynthesis C-methylase UbiE
MILPPEQEGLLGLPRGYIALQEAGSDWSYGSAWGDQMVSAIEDWFCSIAPQKSRVLDVGCGEGRGVEVLRAHGYGAIGVDISLEKLMRGRKRGLPLIRDDIHKLSRLPTKSFDYSFASHCLEHTIDIKEALASVLRVTRKQVLYIIPIHESRQFAAAVNPAHTHPIDDPLEFLEILNSLGLRHTFKEVRRLSDELWGIIDAV